MSRQSKRTSAPAPMETLSPVAQPVSPPGAQPLRPATFPSMSGPGSWCPPCPPQSMAPSSTPFWFPGLQQQGVPGSSAQGAWWAPASVDSSSNVEESDLQVWGYHLTDGIYPEWAAFMKTIPVPQTEKHKVFAKQQEGVRKDVERAFGVLQSRFTIVRSVGRIILACVILHNMIVEDEKEEATIHIDLNESPGASFAPPPEVNVGGNLCFTDVLRRKAAIRSRPQHTQLKNDLIENIWHRFTNNHNN